MLSALHCLESDLDDSYNDTWGQVLPWNGGDIPGTELGYRGDDLAELNEPLAWDRAHSYAAADDTFDCVPLSIDVVYNTSCSYERPVISRSANDNPTFPLPVQHPPMHSPQCLAFQAESHDSKVSLQMTWQNSIPLTDRTISSRGALHSHSKASPGRQMNVCSLPFAEHFNKCQSNNGSMQSVQVPGCSNSQPQQDNRFLSSQALDQHTAMERAYSYKSFASITSDRSNRLKASSSSRKHKKVLCPSCQISFNGHYCKRNLARHMQSVHAGGSFPYKCKEPECIRKYKRSDALRVHQVKVHPDLYARGQPRPKRYLEGE